MGSFYHVLKANKTSQRPRNWCFFDCEARIGDNTDGSEDHTLRLGWAVYRRDSYGAHTPRCVRFVFHTPESYWSRLLSLCENDRRLVLVGYNVGYDLRLVLAFQMLHKMGYTQNRIYTGGRVCIAQWRKGKHIILAIDAMNYFEGKLEQWGNLFGVPKGKVNFRTASDRTLSKYCKQDVEILDRLMLAWFDFIDVHDMGAFAYTRAGQSMTVFRHRFMPCPIYIHANYRALGIERKAYHGGRTECFHIGKLTDGPYYKLDVNNMYPYLMSTIKVPVKLKSIAVHLSIPRIRSLVKKYALCGEFVLKTDDPAYPYKIKQDMVYPVGRFVSHLTTPEIEYALEHKHLKAANRVCIYDKAVLFANYVKYWYTLRLKYKREGNWVFAEMVKYLMNSLYGKFGQKSEKWEKVDNEFSDPDGEYIIIDDDKKTYIRYVVIAGERWNIQGKAESYHSFPAVAAHITAAARIYLWRLICIAGRKEVFYCDTDAILTTQKGKDRLAVYCDEKKLGCLKQEYATNTILIRSPKEYKTDREVKCKGIKPDAKEIRPRVFRQMQWEQLRGSFLAGTSDRVRLKPVVKVLANSYRKGKVHSSGSVSPFTVAEA